MEALRQVLTPQPYSQEKAQGKAGRIASALLRMDLVILDELGYLPFSQADGALLIHMLSKLYEHASVVITTNLSFAGWSTVFGDAKMTTARTYLASSAAAKNLKRTPEATNNNSDVTWTQTEANRIHFSVPGNRLDLWTYCKRQLSVYFYGLATDIPVVGLFPLI